LRDQINAAVDVIVHLSRYPDGSRRVAEVSVVASTRQEEFRLEPLLRFQADRYEVNRRVTGEFRRFPLPRHIAERLYIAGETIPAAFGVRAAPSADGFPYPGGAL
ncbi:secretion protein, partial [Thermobifida cellulosilytica TB100]